MESGGLMRPTFHGRTLLALFVLLLATLVISGCGTGGPRSSEVQTTADRTTTGPGDTTQTAATLASTQTRLEPSPDAEAHIPALAAGNTAFAVELFKAVRDSDATGAENLVLSPYTLSGPPSTFPVWAARDSRLGAVSPPSSFCLEKDRWTRRWRPPRPRVLRPCSRDCPKATGIPTVSR